MQFSYNSDYPGLTEATPSRSAHLQAQNIAQNPRLFPPAEAIPCARITTRVFHPSRKQVATVQDVLVRTINCPVPLDNDLENDDMSLFASSLSSFGDGSDADSGSDGNSNSDGDGDDDNGAFEIQHAYWIKRTIREAIYGQVHFAVILKRRSKSLAMQDGAEWEVTTDHCAVKEMSFQHIWQERNRLAEDPIKEVASMQYLNRLWRQSQRYTMHQQHPQQQQHQNHDHDQHPISPDHCHVDVGQSFSAMRGTNIMMPLDVLSDDRSLYSVMPYCDGGELFERLDLNERFSEDEARYWMDQILNGLANLQEVGICHRDISLENLLVHQDGALIIDMGMCLLVPYHDEFHGNLAASFNNMNMNGGQTLREQQSTMNGTPLSGRRRRRSLILPQGTCGKWVYMSPEIYRNEEPFDGFAVDMWAAGVILFLMLTGVPPWEHPCQNDERFYYMTSGYLVQMLTEWGTGLTSDAMDLLQRMLFLDPKDRLSLEQVRAHPWMANGRRRRPLGLQRSM
eukprot:jgi/Psemu1/214888/e_gw1.714.28.1